MNLSRQPAKKVRVTDFRIHSHPILTIPERNNVQFFWNGIPMDAYQGETISAALMANGVRVFGHHPKDGAPLGIFCANGQCAQCMVLANGKPVKACMKSIDNGMTVFPMTSLPRLPQVQGIGKLEDINEVSTTVLIIGGGPAGLSAAIELAEQGILSLVIDDKDHLGGKLILQTHRFFGSTEAVYAGTRGIDIATHLDQQARSCKQITIWTRTTAVAVFSDKKVGVVRGDEYLLIKPEIILVASGARERSLVFQGNTLPGVYGAGAFQTLVNRDLVRPSENIFIIGGGNVGLIAGYHALQAGINVVGLVEALPECGGYRVHRDKLARLGVPILESHTVVSANGLEQVESITIAEIDSWRKILNGTETTHPCDTILVAVGLSSIDEFYRKAKTFGIPAYIAGDAEEIAEASAAMFSGKITGRTIAQYYRGTTIAIPNEWQQTSELLRSKPGITYPTEEHEVPTGVVPIIHCRQEIPCDPCVNLCSKNLIQLVGSNLLSVPTFVGGADSCIGCGLCVMGCPGLAITLVDSRDDAAYPKVTIPYEFEKESLKIGDHVAVTDVQGEVLTICSVTRVRSTARNDHTNLVELRAPREYACKIAGIRIISDSLIHHIARPFLEDFDDDAIVCRCERVNIKQIRDAIDLGYYDINEIKAVTRAGMGACGSKTCSPLIMRLLENAGIDKDKITENTNRPFFIEIPLGKFVSDQEWDQHA